MTWNDDIARLRQDFEGYATTFVDATYRSGDELGRIVRYILEGRGKRVRAMLCLLSAQACDGPLANALPAALALEMVHAYSLVHDDLPCLDNDNERRGRPSAHRAFTEAGALLAGDALLADAFHVLASPPHDSTWPIKLSASAKVGMVRELASAAGGRGMVWGQTMDVYWTARQGASRTDLDALHLGKTGALIGAACAMGACAADASEERVGEMRRFGQLIGLAFQVTDDLLDEATGTGKSPGKDKRAGKLTYLSVMDRAEASHQAKAYTQEAISMVKPINGKRADTLIAYASDLLGRQY